MKCEPTGLFSSRLSFAPYTSVAVVPYENDYEVGNVVPRTLDFSESVPTEFLDDIQFQVYVGFIMYVTMMFAGLGMEYLVWRMVLKGDWDEDKEHRWRAAQFVFPILGATTVGLANTGNFLALPFLVITMWKLGFPGERQKSFLTFAD